LTLVVVFAISLLICAACCSQCASPLKPRGKNDFEIELASNGTTEYRIVLPECANEAEKKAADVISSALKQISGAEFPVVNESPIFETTGYEISVGHTDIFKKTGVKTECLGLEGYVISVVENTLFLDGGGLRGVINGAYSLLEEDLGCRWYVRNSFDAPEMETLRFAPVARTFVPKLDIRDPYYYEAWDTDWSLQNKTNAPDAFIPQELGGNSKYALFVHTYWKFFNPDLLFNDHPEYFAEVNGKRQPTQLCVTNQDVIQGSIAACRQYLKDNPEATIISISPNDGRGYCECADCKAIDDAEGGKVGSMLMFTNIIADALKDEFPNITFMTLAYLDTFMPPKTIRPGENVAIQLCTDSHAWKYQFCFITESHDFQTAIKAWAAIDAKVYIWDYTVDFVHYLVPMANMPVVQQNIKFYVDNNARGVMLQGAYMSNGCDMSDMRAWVWAKQLWNPDLETKPLMKDFIFGFYKEAAEPIWKYNMMIWDYWEKYHGIPHTCGEPSDNPILNNLHCSYAPDGPMFTEEFMTRASEYMLEAEKLAQSDEIKSRIRKVKAAILYLKICQGVGYYTEFGVFSNGKDLTTTPKRHLENKEQYEALYDELMAVCKEHNITAFSEQNKMSKIVDKWHAILTVDPIPSIELSDAWRFFMDPNDIGIKSEWMKDSEFYGVPNSDLDKDSKTDSDGIAIVRSSKGCGWEAQGFKDYYGVAWYFQSFTLPDDASNIEYLYLFFGAVDTEAWIYINGELVFEHSIASTGLGASALWNQPFAFDAKRYLNPDSVNQLAVRVYSSSGMAGIYRPVLLFPADKKYTAAELDV